MPGECPHHSRATGRRHRRLWQSLVAEVAGEEYYAFDTEFHTERTYVPDLALIQIAWADKVALVDPLAVDPAPLAAVFGGPGIAVAHAASQDLDVLMAACGAVPAIVFDTQIVAGFLGMSTPSLSRLVDADARASPCPRRTGSRTGSNGRSRNARSPTRSATSPTCSSCAPC